MDRKEAVWLSVSMGLIMAALGIIAGWTLHKYVPQSPVAATPSATQSSIQNWNTYRDTKLGYSISYPPAWQEIANLGPNNEKYFSSQNVGAPLEMQPGGIWVTFSIAKESPYYSQLFSSPIGAVASATKQKIQLTKIADLSIGNNPAVKYISETAGGTGTEYSYSINYAISYKKQVYHLEMMAFSKADTESSLVNFDQMARSIKL